MRFVTPQRTWRLIQLDRLKTPFPYIMIAPQARFLEFLYQRARRYPHFSLAFHATVQEVIEEGGVVKACATRTRRRGPRSPRPAHGGRRRPRQPHGPATTGVDPGRFPDQPPDLAIRAWAPKFASGL